VSTSAGCIADRDGVMPSWRMERDGDRTRPEEAVPQSMAFTVTFDSEKTSSNKFVKRHIRNLSLPLAKVYDNKVLNLSSLSKPVQNSTIVIYYLYSF
jgi:hypothetical protein